MQVIEQHKKLISWYQGKLGLSDYGLLWVVFLKGVFLTIVIERISGVVLQAILDKEKFYV